MSNLLSWFIAIVITIWQFPGKAWTWCWKRSLGES